MLLAQIPQYNIAPLGAPPINVNHNVAGNNGPNYVVANIPVVAPVRLTSTDIHLACADLKDHMLTHGHLGYFPMLPPLEGSAVVNRISSRGVFNLPYDTVRQVTNSQRNLYTGYHRFLTNNIDYFDHPQNPTFPAGFQVNNNCFHLLPNVGGSTKYRIDPTGNLRTIADSIINTLLSTNHIANLVIGQVDKNRFTMNITYNFPNIHPNPNPMQNIIQISPAGDCNLGVGLEGRVTNTIRIVVQVLDGVVSIVTMYPI
jgi:hypothetical protein